MTTFIYQARDGRGQLVSGSVSADSVNDASQQLRGEGKFVVKLERGRDAIAETRRAGNVNGSVKRDEVIYFTHQLAIMVDTGVPLGEALDAIVQQTTSDNFKAVLHEVYADVTGGTSLSAALDKHRRVFPALMVSLLKASEVSGTMGAMLERVSQYMAKEQRTVKQVRGALMYPAFMLLMAVTVTAFLLMFVLPRFGKIYASRGALLPLPTRVLIGISNVFTEYWYLILLGLLGAIVAFLWVRRIPAGRRVIDTLKLRLPVFGTIFTHLYVSRATRAMGTMFSAGVPMLDVITITRDVTNNVHYQELWDRVDERLRQGSQLSEPLFDTWLIPRFITRMIHSGEVAGRLGQVMERVGQFTEGDFDESVRRATQFIEPVMVCIMGTIIGGIAISLLLPIFSIGKVLAGG